MNTKKLWMIALVMMIAAAPAFAGEATQMWRCELGDGVDEEMVEAHSAKWLAAAIKVDGGANIKGKVLFPVAVNATGQMDMMLIVTWPSFAEFGKFWDAYSDSDAADIEEDAVDLIVCPDSALWESFTIK